MQKKGCYTLDVKIQRPWFTLRFAFLQAIIPLQKWFVIGDHQHKSWTKYTLVGMVGGNDQISFVRWHSCRFGIAKLMSFWLNHTKHNSPSLVQFSLLGSGFAPFSGAWNIWYLGKCWSSLEQNENQTAVLFCHPTLLIVRCPLQQWFHNFCIEPVCIFLVTLASALIPSASRLQPQLVNTYHDMYLQGFQSELTGR